MRNLKKVLALVLALVMAMSLVTIANASDFTDSSDITYEEAVDVMSAIGVLNGLETGAFNPKGTLTREQAAKIICTMLLGENAEKLGVTSTGFSDVAATRWSAPYIAYCSSLGIVAGNGDGTFNPTGKLTGHAFGKMLLVALGFEGEYTGSNWAINVASDVVANELDKDVDNLVLSADLTREQAAQMAFNGLFYGEKEETTSTKYVVLGVAGQAAPTTVGNLYSTYTAANTASSTGTNAGKVLGTNYTIDTITVTEETTKDSLADTVFDLSKVTSGTTDDFGRPAAAYMQDGEEVAKFATDAVATFTAATSAANVASALSGYKLSTGEKINNSTTVVSAGTGSIVITNGASGKTAISVTSETVAKAIADETANGKVMEFYANDDKEITDIVVVTYTVDTVASISTSKTGTTYTLTGGENGIVYAADQDTDDTIVLGGAIDEDDVVTYVVAKDGEAGEMLYVYPTTSFVGAQSAKTTDTITVNGTKYDLGTAVTGISTFNNSADDANYYVDFNGFVVKTDAVASQTNYAIVDKLALVGATGTGTNQSVEAVLAFADGSTKTVNVSKINGIKAKDVTNAAAAVTTNSSKAVTALSISTTVNSNSALTDVAVSYAEKDGAYELTYLNLKANLSAEGTKADIFDNYAVSTSNGHASAPVTVTVVEKGVPTVVGYGKTNGGAASATVTANNSTVYLIQTGSGDDAKFSSYTGFKNVATVKITGETGGSQTAATATVSYAVNSDGEVTFVYIDATDSRASAGDTATGDILYVSSTDVTETLVGDDTIYELTGIVNGEANVTIKSDDSAVFSGLTKGQVYELTTDNDGYVTAKVLQDANDYSKALNKVTVNTAGEAKEGVIMGYTYGEDTKVIVIDDDAVIGGTIFSAKNGDTIYVKVADKAGTAAEKLAIETIYIVKA